MYTSWTSKGMQAASLCWWWKIQVLQVIQVVEDTGEGHIPLGPTSKGWIQSGGLGKATVHFYKTTIQDTPKHTCLVENLFSPFWVSSRPEEIWVHVTKSKQARAVWGRSQWRGSSLPRPFHRLLLLPSLTPRNDSEEQLRWLREVLSISQKKHVRGPQRGAFPCSHVILKSNKSPKWSHHPSTGPTHTTGHF